VSAHNWLLGSDWGAGIGFIEKGHKKDTQNAKNNSFMLFF
jgi:hypothetical protein